MPNQRHADKRALNCWLPSALHDQLRALATASGLPLTALVTAILTDYAAKHEPPQRTGRTVNNQPRPKYPF